MFAFLSGPSFCRFFLGGISVTSVSRRKKLPIGAVVVIRVLGGDGQSTMDWMKPQEELGGGWILIKDKIGRTSVVFWCQGFPPCPVRRPCRPCFMGIGMGWLRNHPKYWGWGGGYWRCWQVWWWNTQILTNILMLYLLEDWSYSSSLSFSHS